MEDTRIVQDILNDINDYYITFLNQLDSFLEDMDNDKTLNK